MLDHKIVSRVRSVVGDGASKVSTMTRRSSSVERRFVLATPLCNCRAAIFLAERCSVHSRAASFSHDFAPLRAVNASS